MYEPVAPIGSQASQVTVRQAMYDLLRSLGITTIFGNPGSTELPMLKDFPEDFRYILGLQESAVMGMADGFAQANRNAAFVNLHSSAGVGHALGNLFTAYRNRTPLVVTAGQQARSILPFDPFLYAQQATDFPRPFIKWAIEPARAQDVPLAIARAYHVAMTPPQGPTFVSIPIDDWDQMCDPVYPRQVSTASRPDPVLLEKLGAALDAARSPVFVVGSGVARDQAWDEAVALAERYQAQVWETPLYARNAFPQNHPLFAGMLSASREAIVRALGGHDLVVVLGAPVFTAHVEGFGPHVPEGASLFLVTDDPELASWCPVGTAIISTLKLALRDLLSRPVGGKLRVAPPPRPRAARLPATGPLTDALLVQTLEDVRPAGSVIVEEAPSSRPMILAHMPITIPDGYYACASGGLGHGLPAAVGMAMARPDVRVIGLIGDGSAMYCVQGLWNAATLALPMTFVIVRNGRYEALIRFGRLFGIQSLVGAKLPEIDFVSVAQGMGLSAVRVDKAEDLEPALRAAMSSTGPTLVEVVVE